MTARLPHGFWKAHSAEFARMAPTMTAEEVAAHYGSTINRVRQTASALNVRFKQAHVPQWVQHEAQLRALAPRMTYSEIARELNISLSSMQTMLQKLGIKALKQSLNRRPLTTRHEELRQLADTMTTAELAQHFGKAQSTILGELQKLRHGPMPLRTDPWPAREAEMREMATRMTGAEIALHYGIHHGTIYKVLARFGIKCYSNQLVPKTGAQPKKPAAKAAAPALRRSATPPAPRPTKPVQIVMPAHVKVTVLEFCPPANARVCNGTSRGVYRGTPAAVAVGAGTAYGRFLTATSQHARSH
ncbi:winged helix-turn-helix domain-containing protein [Comamonas terrigena]|uniref:winged helix-turn-helix domain-containing protein n=1 Tax=Comamonas terrigena TaxID=32013 RepID=UPI0028AE9ED4|nr:winged helix-turn-helix domain-containing protein [Comamonas terrigena]